MNALVYAGCLVFLVFNFEAIKERSRTARAGLVSGTASETALYSVYQIARFSVPFGGATVFCGLSGPEIAPSDRDFGTPEQRENIVGAK